MIKTLDEVIKAFEHCTDSNPDPDYDSCAECPYCDNVKGCCRDNSHMIDALNYLKAYRDDRNDLSALRAYWVKQQANPPLTWDELRQMEGKPVWVEYITLRTKGWVLVDYIDNDRIDLTVPAAMQLSVFEHQIGKTWQAYWRERT